MKKAILLTLAALVVASLTGCHLCRGWFNRGDDCAPPPAACPPGVPRATMMIPSSPQILPGPIEVAPVQ
ncbi:MAG: hypothetical protein L0211_04020 [Planctomycetaceae bacterium]|nr:hypothetical protein [Planctomycetaceae bacterium]